MEERGMGRVGLIISIVIIAIAIAVSIIGVYHIGKMKREKQNVIENPKNEISENSIIVNSDSKKELEKDIVGKYNVISNDELAYDEGLGRTLDDLYIELYNNNQYTIYDSFGISYFGTYLVDDEGITLNILKWYSESGNDVDVIFTIKETAQIKLTKNGDVLEVKQAPKTIKVNRSDSDQSNKDNVLNIKNGLKYSKTSSQEKLTIEGKYGYRYGDLTYEFEKNGRVHRYGNTNDEKGHYSSSGKEIIMYFEKESVWDADTGNTITKDINKRITMKLEDEKLIDEGGNELEKITERSSNNQSTISALNPVVGEWKASKAVDDKGKEIDLNIVFGNGISNSNNLTFKSNLEYVNGVGVTGEGNEGGNYSVSEDNIILTDIKNRVRTLKYDKAENTLTEELDGGKKIVTYVKNK